MPEASRPGTPPESRRSLTGLRFALTLSLAALLLPGCDPGMDTATRTEARKPAARRPIAGQQRRSHFYPRYQRWRIVQVKPHAGARLPIDLGGVPALLTELKDLLDLEAPTVTGRPLSASLGPVLNADVIRPLTAPLQAAGSLAVLRGNLAPRGAVLRISTAAPELLQHRGPALVFDSYADMLARLDAPDLPVTAETVLVLRNAGAVGVPGMPEWGALPVPQKLLVQGVKDMVRLSDARMSGTSYGTVVLHVAPEAAVGGPLALVRDGDLIELDAPARTLTLHVPAAELERRRAAWRPPSALHRRGYPRLYQDHVLQPDEGCDFDFLRPRTPEDLAFVPPTLGRS